MFLYKWNKYLFLNMKDNYKSFALLAALVIYGLFSSPTPDILSWAEIVMGVLLVVAAGPVNMAGIFSGAVLWHGPREKKFLTISFLTLLIPGTINGFLSGYEINDIVRDVIPLGFFFLSLFLYQPSRNACESEHPIALQRDPRIRKGYEWALLYGLVFTGVLFALRFWPASGLTLSRFGLDRGNDEMLYLTSSPSVLFAGLYLLFKGTELQTQKWYWRLLCLIGAVICLLTLVATLQRAAIFLAALSTFFIFWHRTQRSPNFLFAILATLFVGGLWLAPTLADIVDLIWRKTVEVGDNERFAELHSVIGVLGVNPWHYVFGLGWGAKIVTAASGYADVRYTHMLFSYSLFKTGLIGFVATASYGLWLARRIIRQFPQRAALSCAALPSLILGFTLYPSFKMLCFGAIIALLATGQENHERY
jgi:hypothetical protein